MSWLHLKTYQNSILYGDNRINVKIISIAKCDLQNQNHNP